MKIDKKNYKHWFYLIRSGVFITLTLPVRLWPLRKHKTVVLYGHKLNGNLKAFFDYSQKQELGYRVYFATLDPVYYEQIKDYDNILHLGNLKDIYKLSRSQIIVTDHGLHTLVLYQKLTNIKFVDVWHGVPFKGFDEKDLAHLHKHDQTWVSSERMKKMYTNKFGFNKSKVKVTGYARVDQLINKSLNKGKIINKYSLPKADKYILIAPTWKQDDRGRSVVPFGVTESEFFGQIDKVATKHNACVIFRTHLNSSTEIDTKNLKNILFMPYSKYEITEDFLFIADILVSDWSSIVFDYLPLDRPTIFLDVKAPFKKGFSVGPEHRFGCVVSSLEDLKKTMDSNLNNPENYLNEYSDNISKTKKYIYGDTLDGKSTERYAEELKTLL